MPRLSKLSQKVSGRSYGTNGLSTESIELQKIALMKGTERKERLLRMLEKYQTISQQEKGHLSSIKASIVELKDSCFTDKMKYLLEPTIYVDNNVSIEARKFLCVLMNTFYNLYEQNAQIDDSIRSCTHNISAILTRTQKEEDNLFRMQKHTIEHHVNIEGQHLKLQYSLKDESNKQKELDQQYQTILSIHTDTETSYKEHLKLAEAKKALVGKMNQQIEQSEKDLIRLETMKESHKEAINRQLLFIERLQHESVIFKAEIEKESKRQKELSKKIIQKQKAIQKSKGNIWNDLSQQKTQLKLFSLTACS